MNAACRCAVGLRGRSRWLLRVVACCALAAACPPLNAAADETGAQLRRSPVKEDGLPSPSPSTLTAQEGHPPGKNRPEASHNKIRSKSRRQVYRGQSPGYDSEYAITGGGPASSQYTPSTPASSSGPQPYGGQAGAAGQLPLRRTGPNSTAGYQGGSYQTNSSRYPTAGYGPGATPATPAQFSPSTPPGMYPGTSTGGGYGYTPGTSGPAAAAPPYGQGPTGTGGSPFRPSSPFSSPNGGAPPSGSLGPQGPPPSLTPPAIGSGAAPGGLPGMPPGGFAPGNGLPGMPGYPDQGGLFPPPEGDLPVPIGVGVTETQTGKLNFGVGVNSNAGLIGNVVIDEQNFDWRRVPTSWDEVRNGTAFRGGGQQLRLSAMPGTYFSQYGFTFRDPYLWDTRINFGLDGFYFNRYYQNWTEQRLGGRVSFGYQLTPDLSSSIALRAEDVGIFNPTVPTPPELSAVLGHNALYSVSWTTVHDTRDSPFLPTQGHRFSLELEQAWGTFSFPRAVAGWRQHFLVWERPDGSGRQVINLLSDVGFTGSHTPIFENFFAGGYNTIRGFYFRGASPLDMGVQVGGKFELINTVEYMFPLTAGDALRGVVFTDFGVVEPTTELKWNDFRIAPGAGLRVTIPAMGPAPIALDLAFPVHHAPGDQIQVFNFFVGLQR